ncbi:MAG: ABC-2 type transport system ATP-binding protein [Lentisphaeria bacterium]
MFLDEPTTGLDIEARKTLWANIRAYAECGSAVILTTHYLQEADTLADETVVLNEGQLISQGSPQ